MQIQVNGESRQVREGLTLLELLELLELKPDRVAIELDRRIVRQPEWAATVLRDGAQVEIVQFVGGG